jgi:hypothetical protein
MEHSPHENEMIEMNCWVDDHAREPSPLQLTFAAETALATSEEQIHCEMNALVLLEGYDHAVYITSIEPQVRIDGRRRLSPWSRSCDMCPGNVKRVR